MKILHTSDWHLGKRFYSRSLLEEQQLFVHWLLHKLENEDIDVFILAGDIFDIPHPPTDAITLFYQLLARLEKIEGLRSVIIPGNHDSARFISSINPLISKDKVDIVCEIEGFEKVISVEKENDKVNIQSLSYFKWSELLNLRNKYEIESDDELEILEKTFKKACSLKNDQTTNIFVGHHLFGNFKESGSEQGLHLSGISSVPLKILAPYFDILCLGHIHRAQKVKKQDPLAVYSGAPMAFRFNETAQKSYSLYQIKDGNIDHEFCDIPTFRPILSVECNKENWRKRVTHAIEGITDSPTTAYLEIYIKLDEPDTLLTDEIKQFVSGHNVELVNIKTDLAGLTNQNSSYQDSGFENLSIEELFKIYYKSKFENDVPDEIMSDFLSILQESRFSSNAGVEQ